MMRFGSRLLLFLLLAFTALLELDDSHTIFIPQGRAARLHFGWQMQMIGDRCYVTAVQEGSDARAKGLREGDLVLEVDGHRPTRGNLRGLYYVHRVLAPRSSLPILVQGPGGGPRRIEVAARVDVKRRLKDVGEIIREIENEAILSKHRFKEIGDNLVIWKMPEFDMSIDDVRNEMDRLKKHSALILDLRGNPGGAVETLEGMIGTFVGPKTKIGDVTVDRTSGSVMVSRVFDHMIGDNSGIFFGSSITIADIMMPDGKSLEHAGVVPDELLLPTAEDLAAGRDPALARAASLCGVTIDPATAGGYFPIMWR